jgi:ATP-binding protein involved in chromosome partitioning
LYQAFPRKEIMTEVTEAAVRRALGNVKFGDQDIVSAGFLGGIAIKNGSVQATLEIDPKTAASMEPVRKEAETCISAIPGVLSATVVMTAESKPKTAATSTPNSNGPQAGSDGGAIPGVGAIIAVASGKGGVGKSTVAANLATAMARQGLNVGLLDADIYGPSMPRMLGRTERPDSPDGKQLIPLKAHGVKFMSIGLLVEERTPMIWRGPMVMSAIEQMLRDVAWDGLDILVIDMPPGTGDAQLTLSQRAALAGAVIVSTPQDLALIDARKGLNMFRKVNVPLLGIVENMSHFLCTECGARHDVFGNGGARAEAAKLGVPFLGEVPLEMAIRATSDEGTPIVASQPDSPHAAHYTAIAAAVLQTLERSTQKAGPKIIVE